MPVTATLTVQGMTCGHCENAVRSELSALPGVISVAVDLTTGAVTIESETRLDDAAIRDAVGEAGYTVA
ncbi:cation transporter [Hoyosella sp. YIM 151337]|uniref:heavy-metal-associated domain-containing protein n=1 Tax=Hoyosella sp. YIM 151337 TaxID=2992742 RepID=UPI00223559DC|nr:cation transporter [Hoyosella sp. YIM 151337]MCW4353046.1 cation transporter [Hoyosella sp. YIM 151337]